MIQVGIYEVNFSDWKHTIQYSSNTTLQTANYFKQIFKYWETSWGIVFGSNLNGMQILVCYRAQFK